MNSTKLKLYLYPCTITDCYIIMNYCESTQSLILTILIDATTEDNETPLAYAIGMNRVEVEEYLESLSQSPTTGHTA